METVEKIEDIEYFTGNENKNINNIIPNNNKEQIYKLDFNFDILNEPLPDFPNMNKNKNIFINKKNYTYKRKYNEINSDNYSYHAKPILKIK